jgi:hypothetical protein
VISICLITILPSLYLILKFLIQYKYFFFFFGHPVDATIDSHYSNTTLSNHKDIHSIDCSISIQYKSAQCTASLLNIHFLFQYSLNVQFHVTYIHTFNCSCKAILKLTPPCKISIQQKVHIIYLIISRRLI